MSSKVGHTTRGQIPVKSFLNMSSLLSNLSSLSQRAIHIQVVRNAVSTLLIFIACQTYLHSMTAVNSRTTSYPCRLLTGQNPSIDL